MTDGLHHRHHPLHHVVGGRAIGQVLVMNMYIVLHLLALKMGEARTILGTYGINAAHIGLQVKELTRLLHIHPIARGILVEVLLLEGFHGHAHMRRDPDQILRRIGWAHGFAAVGTAEAIRLFPYLLIDHRGHLVQPLGRVIAEPG